MVLKGDDPGAVADEHHGAWYRVLWAPSVTAGLVTRPTWRYRSGPIYIRRSKHVPPPYEAVRDFMPTFFECLREEHYPPCASYLGMSVAVTQYRNGNVT